MNLFNLIVIFALMPGVFFSIPPGPNKKWIMGQQVTWLNALVHAIIISILII